MDFNVNNAVKIYPQQVIKETAPPPEREAPKEKKKESPVISNLSSLLANANKTPVEKKEEEVMNGLTSIDSELTEMESYLNDLNSRGQLSMEEAGKAIAKLREMEARLKDIEKQLQDLVAMYKAQDDEASKQMDQLSQVGLLRRQIEDQEKLQRQSDRPVSTPAPAANAEAPKAV
jgi:chromosome segregation ATPase